MCGWVYSVIRCIGDSILIVCVGGEGAEVSV